MKKIFPFSLCLFVILFSQQKGFSQTTGNYVPAYIQEQSNWCWAACGSMIYWAYHSGSVSQCAYVAKSRDLENSLPFDCNNLSNSTSSPCTYPATFNSPQSLYTCGGSNENVFDAYGISSTGYGHAFSTSELTTAMSARKMCMARWGWNSGGGHVVVVNRYKSGNVYYNNPLSGAVIWSYNTFKTANGKGTWTNTLRMDNAAIYGSVLSRNAIVKPDVPETTSPNTIAEKMADERMSLNMYPNPAVDNLTILLGKERADMSEIIVMNALGVVFYNQAVSKKTSSLKINVSQWPKGIYMVKLGATGNSRQLVVQ